MLQLIPEQPKKAQRDSNKDESVKGKIVRHAFSTAAVGIGSLFPYCRVHLWLEAHVDARSPTQLDEERNTPFVNEMREHFNKQMAAAASKYERIAASLNSKIETLTSQLPGLKRRRCEQVRPEYAQAEAVMIELNSTCRSHHHKSITAFYIGSIALLLPDIALQFPAFEQEGLAPWQTGLICCAIAVLTGWLAHTHGHVVNQGKRFQMIFIPALMISLFAVIAFVRLANFERVAQELSVNVSPEAVALAYFILNVAIFSVIAMHSAMVHRRAEEECRHAKKAAAKRFAEAAKQYEQVMKIIGRDEAILNDLLAKRGALPKDAQEKSRAIEAAYKQKRHSYLKTLLRLKPM